MLQEYQRPLTAEERSSFQQQLKNGSRKPKKTQSLFLIAVATGSSGLISLIAGLEMNKRATNTSFWPFFIFLCAAPIIPGTIEEVRSYLEELHPRGARTSGQEDHT
jgi:hypothetical protein